MATHSSTLAWKIPWVEEPGRLQSMASQRVGHYWVTLLSLFTFTHWRRKWQPTPVFLPGESQGRGSLVGCHLWGCTESDDWSDLATGDWCGMLISFHIGLQLAGQYCFLEAWGKGPRGQRCRLGFRNDGICPEGQGTNGTLIKHHL